MTRAEGGLDRDAKVLRDKYGVPYVVARKLVHELGIVQATDACEADHAQRAHWIDAHGARMNPERPDLHSTIVGGTCTVCGEIVDPVANEDFMQGPRMVVELTQAMHEALLWVLDGSNARHVLGRATFDIIQDEPLEDGQFPVLYTGRRKDLDRIADEFRNLGRSNHEHAPVARHAAHRIEAALKGARA